MSKFWNVIKNSSGTSGKIELYGPIRSMSFWGDEITPKQLAKDIKELGNVSEINVHINSGGGDVFAGQTIYAILKNHAATVKVHVDGLAASIASVIAMAGDEIIMHEGSMMMIHNPSSSMWGGEAADFRHLADVLDKVRESIVAVYKTKTNLSDEELLKMMDDETWLTAEEAKEKGFASTVTDLQVAASVVGEEMFINGQTINIAQFSNYPKSSAKSKNKEGVKQMDVKQIIASLPEEQQKLVTDYVASITNTEKDAMALKAENAKLNAANEKLQKEIDDLKTAPVVKDPIEDATPEVKAILEATRKAATEAQDALKAMQEEKELANFVAEAQKFDKLAINAEEMGPIFRNFAAADKEGFEKLDALLVAANNAVEQGALFATTGTQAATEPADSAWEEVQAKAKKFVDEKVVGNFSDGITKALKDDVDLYHRYMNETRNYGNDGE